MTTGASDRPDPSSSNSGGYAADDWDEHWNALGGSALRNPANTYRNRLVLHFLSDPAPNSTIVDIGSGQGQLALYLQAQFPYAQILGVEYSSEGVRRATEAAASARLGAKFVQRDLLHSSAGSVESPSSQRASQAVCSEVLEHVDEPQVLLRNAADYMLEGCRLVVTVPGGPMSALDRHIGHRRHYDPRALRNLLEASGFRVEKISRAGFPFFNLYRLAVIARGNGLIDDMKSNPTPAALNTQRLVSAAFSASFRANLTNSPFGWQIVGVARLKGA